MKLAGICFSDHGIHLAEKIDRVLHEIEIYPNIETEWVCRGSFYHPKKDALVAPLRDSLHAWTGRVFENSDMLIFIGALGNAVRAIAPYLRDRRYDPAVIVFDDEGHHCVPVLSGHIGGAAEFAKRISPHLGAEPVITISMDMRNKFAVEQYARAHDLTISNETYAKEVTAAILSDEPVGFYTHFPVKGSLPEGIVWSDKLDQAMKESGERGGGVSLGIYISPSYNRAYFDHTLWLIPRCLSIGIDCGDDCSLAEIRRLVRESLDGLSLYQEAVSAVAAPEHAKACEGLLEYCKESDLALNFYDSKELEAEGDTALCERCATRDANGQLLIRAISNGAVSCAVAMKDWSVTF